MVEEVVWVGETGVAGFVVAVVVGGSVSGPWIVGFGRVGLAVVEDDDFVDAEDGEGAGDLRGQHCFCFVVLCTVEGDSLAGTIARSDKYCLRHILYNSSVDDEERKQMKHKDQALFVLPKSRMLQYGRRYSVERILTLQSHSPEEQCSMYAAYHL